GPALPSSGWSTPPVRALGTPSQRCSPVGAPAKASEVTVKPVRSAAALVGWITPSSFRSSGGPLAGKGGTRWAAAPVAVARSASTAMEKRAMKPAYPRDRGAQSGAPHAGGEVRTDVVSGSAAFGEVTEWSKVHAC